MNQRQAPPHGDSGPGGGENRTRRAFHSRRAPRRQDNALVVHAGDSPVLIPPGEYIATGGHFHLRRPFGVLKLYVDFDVEISDGVVVLLQRYYNVKPGPRGGFTAGRASHYFREWSMATGRRPSKGQPLPPTAFDGVRARVAVETVSVDSTQQDLDPITGCYSRIARIREVLNRGIP